jgi:hypothetical protein
MSQIVTHVSEAFSFSELSDSAKERARDWYRGCIDELDYSCEEEEFITIGEALGITFDTRETELMSGKKRQEPNIYWSVGYCQSDYASFEGTYDYKADACIKLREINNDDSWEPLRIAMALAKIQCENAFGIRAVFNSTNNGGMSIDVKDRRNEERSLGDDYQAVVECIRDLARYLDQQLRDQSDYLHSEEAVDQSIEANEYMFDEEGNRHAYA